MTVTRKLNNYAPKVELFGDWDKVNFLLETIDTTIKVGAILGQKSAAEKILVIVKKNIRENGGSLGWAPLSEKYKEYKIKKGYNPDSILRMTGLYYKSITKWSNGMNYFVGVKRSTRYTKRKGKNLTVTQVATILEHGSSILNIPARPLWGPSYKQFGGNARLKSLMIWHIRNQIYLRYQIRAKIKI